MARQAKLTTDQLAEVLTFFKEERSSDEIAGIIGVPRGTISATRANWTRGAYDHLDIGETSAGVEEIDDEKLIKTAERTVFRIESDMQNALRRHIDQLEPNLTIIDNGSEKVVSFGGRIDITARDEVGVAVVIELKAGPADHNAIAQILSYVGALSETERNVRGILVAGGFSAQAVAAARAAPNIRLLKYGYTFTFDPVEDGNAKAAIP